MLGLVGQATCTCTCVCINMRRKGPGTCEGLGEGLDTYVGRGFMFH